ncbi:MAG: DUF4422 domain-containing protein, partial [Propionibacteriaceae bacterium]|nr:DUF4422 domain-containing protein [Propionibacteriaceae bacterium]
PNKRHYVIETVGKHYAHAHHASDLDAARAVLEEAHPDYLPSFDAVLAARSLSLYNMFAMRRQHLDEYCQWLFPVLEEVWTRIPWDSYGPTQQRAIGYLGERLFNVWLRQRADLRVTHRPIHNTEREPVISKGVKMVGRKLGVGKAD